MNLNCPHCRRSIPAGDINIQSALAKCASCSAVFGFADKVPGAAAALAKRVVEMPKGYTMTAEGADLVLIRRWFSAKFVFLLFFCAFWDGFLIFWYGIALSKGAPLLAMVFPLIHVAVGVGLTYFTLAGFLNRTRIKMSTGEVSIKHYPLPWAGNRTLRRQEIDQLFCEEKLSRNRNSSATYSYNLSAVLADGRRIKLISGLDQPEDALFLEQKIEGYIGIADRPVAGEMRPV
ncbi:MAG: hypothetical protein NDI60_00375 [Elusimicrobiales bacterium]|nr:hypothetical protein [Elusimicrobiales bacterium]